MDCKERLLRDIAFIHATEMSMVRIREGLNLPLDIDPVEYVKEKLHDPICKVYKTNTSFYAHWKDEKYTITVKDLLIITAKHY